MPEPTPGRFRREFVLLGLAIFFFYGVLLWAPMIYDDVSFILRNPAVTGAWGGLGTVLYSGPGGAAFSPLVGLLHRAIFFLAGARPLPYRLSSLLLHWANAGLVLALFSRDLRNRRLAFLAALLFSVFPMNVETLAVANYKQHSLVALFTLTALLLQDRRSWPVPARVGGAWLLFVLALACKETAVVLPALAAARLLQKRGEPESARAPEVAALFSGWAALLAAYLLLRARVAPRLPTAWAGGGPATNFLTSLNIFAGSLRRLALPWPLSLEHSLAPAPFPPDARTWLSAVVAAAAFAGTCVLYRRKRRAWFGAAWVLIALAPFLNLLPYLSYILTADRYLYLASIGFFLFAAVTIEEAFESPRTRPLRRWLAPALLGLAAAYGAAGVSYAALFADPRDVWANAARRAPDNPRAHGAYGAALAQGGQDVAAVAELRRALSLDPDYPAPYFDLAAAESRLSRADAAVAVMEELVRRAPSAEAWRNLGVYRLKAGLVGPALEALARAEEAAPGDPATRLDLGYAQLAARRWADADESFRAAAASPELRARALAGRDEAAKGAGSAPAASARRDPN